MQRSSMSPEEFSGMVDVHFDSVYLANIMKDLFSLLV